jgi:hypothetical protein
MPRWRNPAAPEPEPQPEPALPEAARACQPPGLFRLGGAEKAA